MRATKVGVQDLLELGAQVNTLAWDPEGLNFTNKGELHII